MKKRWIRGDGMPKRIPEETRKAIIKALEDGDVVKDIADKTGVSDSAIYNIRRDWLKTSAKGDIMNVSEGYLREEAKESAKGRAQKIVALSDNPEALKASLTEELKAMVQTIERRLEKAETEIDSLEDAVGENYEELKEEFSDRDISEDTTEDTPYDEMNRGDVLDLGEVEAEDKHSSEDLVKLLLAAGGLYLGMRLLPKNKDMNIKREEDW